MIAGCYTAHFYCDVDGCHSRLEVGDGQTQTAGDCYTVARREGWTLNQKKTEAYCPKHKYAPRRQHKDT